LISKSELGRESDWGGYRDTDQSRDVAGEEDSAGLRVVIKPPPLRLRDSIRYTETDISHSNKNKDDVVTTTNTHSLSPIQSH